MFERQRAVLGAAGVAYLLCGFLVALAAGSAYYASQKDPHRLVRQWDQVLSQRGQFIGVGLLGGLLLFAVALAGLFAGLAVAARARRLHPTSGTLGGLFLAAGMLSLMVLAVWTGVVSPYAALQYQWTPEAATRQALLMEARLGEHLSLLALWCFLSFVALGLYFLGRALRGEHGWTADMLKLAAALILLHLPVALYLARESLRHEHYIRWLAVLDQLLVWGGLALACHFCARWLRALGHTLPR